MENRNNQNQNQTNTRDSQGRYKEETNSQQASSSSRSTQANNPGNFANDRQRAAEAGRKGGQNSHGGNRSSNSYGH